MSETNSDETSKSKGALSRLMRPGFLISRGLITLAGIYLLRLALLLFNKNDLVYPGAPDPQGDWNPEFQFEEVKLDAADGTELVGWYLPPPSNQNCQQCRTVLILHGNAENVAEVSAYAG
jgi:hypothetical protein